MGSHVDPLVRKVILFHSCYMHYYQDLGVYTVKNSASVIWYVNTTLKPWGIMVRSDFEYANMNMQDILIGLPLELSE